MRETATHENLAREIDVKGSSDRSFCVVMAAFFLLVSLKPLLSHGNVRLWSLGVSFLWVVIAVTRPAIVHPLNYLWTQLGLLLGRIVNPLVMGIMFYLVVTPAALIMRWLGKDPLKLRYDQAASSYWILREPPGPPPDTMSNQF